MSTGSNPPIIYNLFPRHFPTIDDWAGQLPHIADMGFNAVFVNPFFATGFSGSLYAVKDYYRLNPLFLAPSADPSDFSPVERFKESCTEHGIELIVDLVINHTAFDSLLTTEHPAWYKRDETGALVSPFAVDPGDASKVTVWGDLASIDNENSPEREELWKYWDDFIGFLQRKGIRGFRCDAAYQVPMELWKTLIASAKRRDPKARFYAETLGCLPEQIEALAPAGFDYLFNSVKWWEYDHSWALDQHTENQLIAPSVAFPESHDTERLASEPPGTIGVQKSRYAFAALFSGGLLMPMGYEFGAVTRIDVVKGTPEDVDAPQWDLSAWIAAINTLKTSVPVLAEEGIWKTLNGYADQFLFLEKKSAGVNPPVIACVNKSSVAETVVEEWMVPEQVRTCTKALSLLAEQPAEEEVPVAFTLDPADVVLFLQ
jgi:starch synthase (maltosyl-transferring)